MVPHPHEGRPAISEQTAKKHHNVPPYEVFKRSKREKSKPVGLSDCLWGASLRPSPALIGPCSIADRLQCTAAAQTQQRHGTITWQRGQGWRCARHTVRHARATAWTHHHQARIVLHGIHHAMVLAMATTAGGYTRLVNLAGPSRSQRVGRHRFQNGSAPGQQHQQ